MFDLEQALHDWSSDTLQGPATSSARRLLRSMVVRLGELAKRTWRELDAAEISALQDA